MRIAHHCPPSTAAGAPAPACTGCSRRRRRGADLESCASRGRQRYVRRAGAVAPGRARNSRQGEAMESMLSLGLNRSRHPGLVDELSVPGMMRAEGDELQTLGSGLEGSRDLRSDADRVQGAKVEDLVVELDPPGAAQDDVDLLGLGVAVGERRPPSRPPTGMCEARLLRLAPPSPNARLPP